MKKLLAMILSLAMLLALASCGSGASSASTPAPGSEPAAESNEAAEPAAEPDAEPAAESGSESGAEIALIIYPNETGVNDKSYCQACWEGVSAYAEENGKTYAYYQPTDGALESYMAAFEMAVNNGAKVICCASYLLGDSLAEAQEKYPDIAFIGVDILTLPTVADNTVSIVFNTTEGTFFAGAAAVYEGYTNLGALNATDNPPVNSWLYGFIQGANWAAGELGIENVTLKTYYTGSGEASPEMQALAASWYETGVECIFANLGSGNSSIFSAAEAAGTVAIGCDTDQAGESDTVITSAVKELAKELGEALDLFYNDQFPGGQMITVGVKEGATGLAMENNRLSNYTAELYAEQYAAMQNDENGMLSNLINFGGVADLNELAEQMTNIDVQVISD